MIMRPRVAATNFCLGLVRVPQMVRFARIICLPELVGDRHCFLHSQRRCTRNLAWFVNGFSRETLRFLLKGVEL